MFLKIDFKILKNTVLSETFSGKIGVKYAIFVVSFSAVSRVSLGIPVFVLAKTEVEPTFLIRPCSDQNDDKCYDVFITFVFLYWHC